MLFTIFRNSSSVNAREVCDVMPPFDIVVSIAFAIASSFGASEMTTMS
jgi:hypothetical protein